jgi:hypothetical protein
MFCDCRLLQIHAYGSGPGQYRLFAFAEDDHGHVAHANLPFLVQSEKL